uniref:DUF1772 domain-containing protein n=1 Tax=Oscillatoriales cyanobacterium SpSt-402 TaxID=2282168 RepID=A0A832H1N2_9CYAN
MEIVAHWRMPITFVAALGCGLVAGVFFAFSTFVMSALAQQPPAQGIATMQSINITVINPWFMTAFLGTGATCLLLVLVSLFQWQQPGTAYVLIGALLYLVGTFSITIAFNVPLNNALAVAKPGSSESTDLWVSYLTNWTTWNHVRTIAALTAATFLTLSLCDRILK